MTLAGKTEALVATVFSHWTLQRRLPASAVAARKRGGLVFVVGYTHASVDNLLLRVHQRRQAYDWCVDPVLLRAPNRDCTSAAHLRDAVCTLREDSKPDYYKKVTRR